MKSTKEKLISEFKKRVEKMALFEHIDPKIRDQQIAILLGELQIAEIRLEMQNDELMASSELLGNERSKFASFFNNAPVPYFILDYLGAITEVNEIGIELLEIERDKVLNQRIQSFINSEDLERFFLFLQSMRPNGEKKTVEVKMVFRHRGQKYVRLEGVAFFKSFTGQLQYYIALIDVTKEKHIAQAALELQEEKQRIVLATTIEAQEKERLKISSALHDSVCQLLYGIRLNMLQGKDDQQRADFRNINNLLTQAIKEIRQLSYDLAPSILRDFGFVEAVKDIIDRLLTPNFKVHLQVDEHIDKLSSDLQLNIFRIIQELLNNCIKHANATKIEIVIIVDEMVSILFKDNGRGFPAQFDLAIAKGSGLRNIKSRVFLLDGVIELISNFGAEIRIKFKREIKNET